MLPESANATVDIGPNKTTVTNKVISVAVKRRRLPNKRSRRLKIPQVLVTKIAAQANEVKKGQITNKEPKPRPIKASRTARRLVIIGFTIRVLLSSITIAGIKPQTPIKTKSPNIGAHMHNLAETRGFEPPIRVLAPMLP